LPLAANPPTFAVPTKTTQGTTPLPATETIASSPLPPLPTVPDHQAFTEYRNGTLWVRLFYPQDEAVVSPLQKLTTEHTKYTERARFMNKRIIFLSVGVCKKNFHSPIFD
jgi:hypothetical protein